MRYKKICICFGWELLPYFKWTGKHYGRIGDAMVLLTRASSTENGVATLMHVQDVCVSGFFCWCCQTQIIVWYSAYLFAEFTYFHKTIPAGWSDEISYWCKTSTIPHGHFLCTSGMGSCWFIAVSLISTVPSRGVSLGAFLLPLFFPRCSLVSQAASVQRNKKPRAAFFCFFWHRHSMAVPIRELYWNRFLCELFIAIHWWLSRKGQIRAQSTRVAPRGARLKIDFAIRSENQFI